MTRPQQQYFRNLWERNANQYDFYELAIEMRPDITFQEFWHGWQYRTVLHPKISEGKKELLSILNGCI
jgi:hypothetical protein